MVAACTIPSSHDVPQTLPRVVSTHGIFTSTRQERHVSLRNATQELSILMVEMDVATVMPTTVREAFVGLFFGTTIHRFFAVSHRCTVTEVIHVFRSDR